MDVSPVRLADVAAALDETWSPAVVARLGDQYVKVARLHGQFVWHAHADEDEAFLVLRGRLVIRMEGGDVTLEEGDLFVVPRGVRHCPVAQEECLVALIEPVSTAHTGDVVTDRTRSVDDQLRAGRRRTTPVRPAGPDASDDPPTTETE